MFYDLPLPVYLLITLFGAGFSIFFAFRTLKNKAKLTMTLVFALGFVISVMSAATKIISVYNSTDVSENTMRSILIAALVIFFLLVVFAVFKDYKGRRNKN